ADGFEQLSQKDRVLCYHLVQAAVAGRDINLDQRFAYNLGIRWVLESLYLVKDKLAPDVRKEVERYTKLFWVHNGIHDNHSTQKNLLALSWEQFDAACEIARQNGINMAAQLLAPGRPSDAVAQERIGELEDRRKLYAILTDPSTFRSVT